MKHLFLIFCIIFYSNIAKADLCGYITLKQANEAVEILKQTKTIVHHCPSCDAKENYYRYLNNEDNKKYEHYEATLEYLRKEMYLELSKENVEKVEYKDTGYIEDDIMLYQIYVNDYPVDIAYIFIVNNDKAESLGLKVKCFELDWYNDYFKNSNIKYPEIINL